MTRLRFPACAFMCISVLMLVLFFLLPKKEYSSAERRYLASFPEITLETIANGEFSEAFEGWVSDHFPGRNLFVGVNAYWNLLTGRNTACDVYHCKEGYLMNAPESVPLTQLQTNLERYRRFAADTGLPATLFMIPTAGDVLEEVLPAHHAPYRYGDCYALARQTCPDFTIPDLREALRAVRDRQPYYKTDHHLTSAGCYAVYDAFCRETNRTPLPEEAYEITAYDGFHGSTWTSSGYWLTPSETLEIWDSGMPLKVVIQDFDREDIHSDTAFFLENLTSDDPYTVFLDGNHPLVRIENPNADGGKLLLLRDSYAHCLAPFLACNYREIVLVDLRYYRLSVSELVERFDITELGIVYGLDNFLTDTNSAWLS